MSIQKRARKKDVGTSQLSGGVHSAFTVGIQSKYIAILRYRKTNWNRQCVREASSGLTADSRVRSTTGSAVLLLQLAQCEQPRK
jgi:hypothetical protein